MSLAIKPVLAYKACLSFLQKACQCTLTFVNYTTPLVLLKSCLFGTIPFFPDSSNSNEWKTDLNNTASVFHKKEDQFL
jgi:hypothetical protein